MDMGFITVTQLNGYIRTLFERDDVLSSISVCGEISNIKYHASGHIYLTLKDENSTLSAVMFRADAAMLSFRPENGMRVIAAGRVSIYERNGQYQLYVTHMRPDGLGQLYMAFEALKKKLMSEGLFDASRKKALPRYPKRIGVVTSSTGAVIKDMIKVTGRRYPVADIVLFPVHVQGDEAVPEICGGIEYFNLEGNVDVIIVGRGGGSLEDLWAFNSEAVARAVASSEIPVISAVGHQTDFTICDMVADVTAGTPSMAAELAVPDIGQLRAYLSKELALMSGKLQKQIDDNRIFLDERANVLELNSPKNRLKNTRLLLETNADRLLNLIRTRVGASEGALAENAARLVALNPLAILARGYGLVQDDKGQTLCGVEKISVGDGITITMTDGIARATVTDKEVK